MMQTRSIVHALCVYLVVTLSAQGVEAWASDTVVMPTSTTELKSRSAEIRLGIERIKLPGDEKEGLVGASYLLEALPGLYVGPAAYGTASGSRGGFFTGGWETAWRYPLASHIDFETGLYVGGGGGHGAPVGGGLMLRPHVDVLWNWGGVRTGVSLSQVRFPSGDIRSNQVGLVVSFDDRFLYTEPESVGQSLPFSGRAGVGFDRIALTAFSYKPNFRDSETGQDVTSSIGLAGFQLEQQRSEHVMWGIEAAGAGKGSASGYAEVLGTVGVETPVLSNMYLGVRGALGMGGGGSVSSGGGLLAKAAVYARYDLSRDYYVGLEGGYVTAPTHDFRAKYGLLALGMNLDHASTSGESQSATVQGWEWSPSVERYNSAARKDGSNRSLDLIGIKIRHDIGQNIYLTGQAHSAFAGGAGAFSVGLAGLGVQSSPNPMGFSVGGEFLVGAAGGGGVDSKGGAIIQPMLYGSLNLNKAWTLKLGVGKTRSVQSDGLNSTVLDVSLGYRFGLPAR